MKTSLKNFKPYDPGVSYPKLEALKQEWKKASELLNNALASADESFLEKDAPINSPIGDKSNGGTLAFLTQHESCDIGQIGFLKKYYTQEAMKY